MKEFSYRIVFFLRIRVIDFKELYTKNTVMAGMRACHVGKGTSGNVFLFICEQNNK